MGEFKDGDVSLTVSWEPGKGWLLGRYQVANAGAARLVVFDRLYVTAPNGGRTVDPDLAWRWLDDGAVYRIAKIVTDVPKGRRVESPDLPYARLLEPGAVLAGQVVVPLPLDQALPYGQNPGLGPVDQVKALGLVIGYAVIDDQAEANAIDAGGEPVWSMPFGWAITRQRLVRAEDQPVSLPMRVGGMATP